MDIYELNATIRLEVWALNSSNAGVTSASVTLAIKRNSDGQWWNGSAFQAGVSSVSMTETDATNFAGLYHYDFVTTGLATATYTCKATTATAAVTNDPWITTVRSGGYVTDIELARKHVANKVEITAGAYIVYDDDGTTTLEAGTTSVTTGYRRP